MRQKASKGLNWGWIFRTDQHSGKCKAENDRSPSRKAKACSKKTSMMTKRENEKGGLGSRSHCVCMIGMDLQFEAWWWSN